MIPVTNLRQGKYFEQDGVPFEVLKYSHSSLGRGSAKIKIKARNLKTGAVTEKTFISGNKVSPAEVKKRTAQYLYQDKKDYYFMDQENFNQFTLSSDILKERTKFLKQGEKARILFYKNQPLSIELPLKVRFKVIEAPPGVKGDTTTNVFKEVVLENKMRIKTPLFVKKGDTIVVDTRTVEYVKKVS